MVSKEACWGRNGHAFVEGSCKRDRPLPIYCQASVIGSLPRFRLGGSPLTCYCVSTSRRVDRIRISLLRLAIASTTAVAMSQFRAKKLDIGCFVNIRNIRDHTKRKVYAEFEPERYAPLRRRESHG